jgi:multidrug efflux pump subunit AcrB
MQSVAFFMDARSAILGFFMIGIVRIALKRPYTFVVLAIFIFIVGPLAAFRMPTDIFPDIKIPVISVVWQYTGLPPDQMAGRIMSPFERVLTTTVNDVEHIEGQSIAGYGVVKIFFQPTVDIRTANAQVTSIAQVILKQLPPGATPPLILNYNASTVPIIQLALSGKGLSEQNLGDLGLNQLRPILTTVAGAALPYPYGGKTRQIQINVNPSRLEARGLSAQDVGDALAAQNLITPVGTEKIGNYEYTLQLNNAPSKIDAIAAMPIKSANGTTVYMRDVADVTDGSPPQTNIVHVDGKRSVLMTVLKNGSASTLAIIAGIKERVADAKASLPDNLQIDAIGDQSIFVRAAISGVAREGLIAAVLTSLMILLFLGSWRSTVIIATSIPLAILGSISVLSMLGETLNIMTLGGLALAVGILVDDATVTIENINWHLEQGKLVDNAILDGAAQIVTPAFVSLLCICIVFVPMFFLDGVARFLFVPMAEAVIFAMVSSFILSRTLVPTMAKYLLKPHVHNDDHEPLDTTNPLKRFQRGFEARFERVRSSYSTILELILVKRRGFVVGFFAFVLVSFSLVPLLGRNFFPDVDAGQILLHVRAPVGVRVERTAQIFADVEKRIRSTIPPSELGTVVDNMGLSISGLNTAYSNTGTIGSQDGDIQISLKEGHRPTAEYVRKLREELPHAFPGVTFSFPPADIISQILNFGSPAPIDLQIRGNNLPGDFAYANQLLRQIKRIPGVVDARIQQSQANPQFDINVDRTQAQLQGLTERDVTNSLVVHLAGSSQVAPTYWLNPANGVEYPIVLQTPQYGLDTLPSLQNLPLTGGTPSNDGQILGGVAAIHRTAGDEVVSQYNIQPMVEIFATTQGRDLGAVATDIGHVVSANAKDVPKGAKVVLLGQVQTMNNTFSGMLFGLLGAVVLIYLLIVVNFQSWADPVVIVSALPGALAGIVWMLFATDTTLSVPALTGAIMCMGVATANSILVVSFCRERLAEHGDAFKAALEAGSTRFRPVLMTALSMIIGMAPMALALGEGGEQNAPLGRAVIGGLLFATIATLFLVPAVFCMFHSGRGRTSTAPISGDSTHVV